MWKKPFKGNHSTEQNHIAFKFILNTTVDIFHYLKASNNFFLFFFQPQIKDFSSDKPRCSPARVISGEFFTNINIPSKHQLDLHEPANSGDLPTSIISIDFWQEIKHCYGTWMVWSIQAFLCVLMLWFTFEIHSRIPMPKTGHVFYRTKAWRLLKILIKHNIKLSCMIILFPEIFAKPTKSSNSTITVNSLMGIFCPGQ